MDNDSLARSQIHIPSELIKFLKQETYSLLIKGYAGTGKTTLALSILHEMKIDKNCLYISTRVSPDQLFQYYPWLGEIFVPPTKTNPTEFSETLSGKPTIIDARLDEPNTLFERITNELMDVQAPTIILDTWDAVSYFMDKDALMNNSRVLQTWRERAGAKLIFISESPDDKTFDFLVDGIAELKIRHHNERRVREIFLSKLRGVRVDRPSHLFSVNNGVFHSYERHNPSEFLRYAHLLVPNKIKDSEPNGEYVSSGYHEFDELLGGGFLQGYAVSIELESNVNAKVVLAFLSKIFFNFMNNQDMLVLQSLENSSIELMEKHLKMKGNQHELVNIFKFTHDADTKKGEKTNSDNIQEVILNLKKKFPKKHLLTMISSDFIEEMKTKQELNPFLHFVKDNSAVSIFVSRNSGNDFSPLQQLADIRVKITDVNGTILIQPEVPWSHLYAMVLKQGKEDQIDLDPIV